MKILSMAYYTILKYSRNIIVLVLFILAPVITAYITTNSMVNKNYEKVSRENTVIYSEVKNDVYKKVKLALSLDKIKKNIKLKEAGSFNEAMKKLDNFDADSFIYIDSSSNVKVYSSKNISITKTVLKSFVNSNNAAFEVIKTGKVPDLKTYANFKNNYIINNSNSVLDDTVITNLLLFIFYGLLISSSIFLNDRVKNTGIRHTAAPVTYTENYLGKSIGNVVMMFFSSIIVILITKYFLKVNWSGNYVKILLTFLVFSIIANSIGIILAAIFNNITMCVLGGFVINFSLVYPVMLNAYNPGATSALNFTTAISPHYYAYKVITSNIYGNVNVEGNSLLILLLIMFILLCISWAAGRRSFK